MPSLTKNVHFIPGWATDEKIFTSIDKLKPTQKITLIGFSMGAFKATDIAIKNPEKIEKLILISLRPSYPKKDLDQIRLYLKKNPKIYLKQFYKACFFTNKEHQLFQKTLENLYLNTFTVDHLLEGLEYLETAQWSPEKIPTSLPWLIIQGTQDTIAPYDTLIPCLKNHKKHLISLENTGHIPFYSKEFNDVISLFS